MHLTGQSYEKLQSGQPNLSPQENHKANILKAISKDLKEKRDGLNKSKWCVTSMMSFSDNITILVYKMRGVDVV